MPIRAVRTAKDVRLAGIVLRLWDGGIDMADGGRVWVGSQDALAELSGINACYLSHLLGEAVRTGMASKRAGARGCWMVSAEQREAAREMLG